MKTRFQIVGFFYVVFALVVAHVALAPHKAVTTRDCVERSVLDATPQTLCDYQRVFRFGEGIGPYDPENLPDPINQTPTKSDYTVKVWTADWCGPCQRYKRVEVPAILKAGYKVNVLDYDTDSPPNTITKVPTVCLYFKGILLQTKTYWKAEDIIKYIDNHLSLKGEPW